MDQKKREQIEDRLMGLLGGRPEEPSRRRRPVVDEAFLERAWAANAANRRVEVPAEAPKLPPPATRRTKRGER